jgi:hypothetical protein
VLTRSFPLVGGACSGVEFIPERITMMMLDQNPDAGGDWRRTVTRFDIQLIGSNRMLKNPEKACLAGW